MTAVEKFVQGIRELGLQIEPDVKTIPAGEYVVFSYDSSGTLWGDDGPCMEHRRWTVVYVTPLSVNRDTMRQQIMELIFELFGAWPSEDPDTDKCGQIYLYTFETIGGIDDG